MSEVVRQKLSGSRRFLSLGVFWPGSKIHDIIGVDLTSIYFGRINFYMFSGVLSALYCTDMLTFRDDRTV